MHHGFNIYHGEIILWCATLVVPCNRGQGKWHSTGTGTLVVVQHWPFSNHLTSKIELFDKALAAIWTKMTLLVLDPHVSVQFVRFQLTFGDEAATTHVAEERLFASVDSQVVVQLCFASK